VLSELDADRFAVQIARENYESRELLARAWNAMSIPIEPEGFPPRVGSACAAVLRGPSG